MAVFQVNFMAETLGRTVPLFAILPTDKSYLPIRTGSTEQGSRDGLRREILLS